MRPTECFAGVPGLVETERRSRRDDARGRPRRPRRGLPAPPGRARVQLPLGRLFGRLPRLGRRGVAGYWGDARRPRPDGPGPGAARPFPRRSRSVSPSATTCSRSGPARGRHRACACRSGSTTPKHVPSGRAVWPTADWQEREVWDMMGIRFTRPSRPPPHPHGGRLGGLPAPQGLPDRRRAGAVLGRGVSEPPGPIIRRLDGCKAAPCRVL